MYQHTTAQYYMVQTWSQEQLQKGLHHDFGTLGRNAVELHYHTKPTQCNERCETMQNPALSKEDSGTHE